MIIIITFITLFLVLFLAFIFFFTFRVEGAKKEARKIIASGRITDLKKTNHVMKGLGYAPFNLETKELWRKLQAMKDAQKLI